ncbi:MAG: hypothetical protein ACEPOZ_00195 [Marinifilaceae bacterium]
MKKLLFLLAICLGVVSGSFSQDIGKTMTDIQNVYVGSKYTYNVPNDAGFRYDWEVYTDAACNNVVLDGEVTIEGNKKDASDITLTWNGPGGLTADKDYFLKLVKTSVGESCPNFKVLHVVLKATTDMDVLFANATSADCSVNLTGENVVIPVALSGSGFIHRTGQQVSVWYTVNSENAGDAEELEVSLTADADGNYSITIPNGKLTNLNPLASADYIIRLFKMKDGSGVVKDLVVADHTHTWTAHPLPTIDNIQY